MKCANYSLCNNPFLLVFILVVVCSRGSTSSQVLAENCGFTALLQESLTERDFLTKDCIEAGDLETLGQSILEKIRLADPEHNDEKLVSLIASESKALFKWLDSGDSRQKLVGVCDN